MRSGVRRDVGLPQNVEASPAERTRFEREIQKQAGKRFDPAELQDEYAEGFRKLIERKRRERRDVISAPETAEAAGPEPDLIDLIRRSMRGGGSKAARSKGNRNGNGRRGKRAEGKRSAGRSSRR